MISPSGSAYYQDDYNLIYQVDWKSYENCTDMEISLLTFDPNIPGTQGEILIKNNAIFKQGIITHDRKLIRLDSSSGRIKSLDEPNVFISESEVFDANRYIGRKVTAKILKADRTYTQVSCSILEVRSTTEVLLDTALDVGRASLIFSDDVSILADGVEQRVDFVQISFPYGNGPVNNFRYNLNQAVSDNAISEVTIGDAFTDVPSINEAAWGYVEFNSAGDLNFIDVFSLPPIISVGYDGGSASVTPTSILDGGDASGSFDTIVDGGSA